MKHPLTGFDPGNNIGMNIPDFTYKFVDGDSIEMLDIIFGVDERGTTRFVIDKVYGMGISVEIEKAMSDAVVEVLVNVDGLRGSVEGKIEEIVEAYK